MGQGYLFIFHYFILFYLLTLFTVKQSNSNTIQKSKQRAFTMANTSPKGIS